MGSSDPTPTLLCVLPVRWPLSQSAQASIDTWLPECDGVLLGASVAQLEGHMKVSSSVPMAGGKIAQIEATHLQHDGARDVWLPVRAAIAHATWRHMAPRAAAPERTRHQPQHQPQQQTYDWMVIAEDDAYVSIPRMRHFLRAYKPSDSWAFGACACGRCPGVGVFSEGALRHHGHNLSHCGPDHVRDR